jgi:replicative DNA helicase
MQPMIDADYATIGGLLLEPNQLAAVSGWLRPEDFARPLCGEVYQLVVGMHDRGVPVDPVTVLGEFRARGRVRADGYPGGELIAMVEAVPVPEATPYYARQVLAAAVFRRVEACGTRLSQVGRLGRGGPQDALDAAAGTWRELGAISDRWRAANGVGPARTSNNPGRDAARLPAPEVVRAIRAR